MTIPQFHANSELVTQAWIASLPGFNSGMVATTLPENNAAWAASGFVTLKVVGGSPEMYVPERKPVMELGFWWAPTPGSRKPQWAMANALAEQLVNLVYDESVFNAVLNLGPQYPTAQMQQAHWLQEPRRIYGTKDYRALYQGELWTVWRELPS